MASAISNLRLAQACVAAAGRLRGVAAERLQPKALVEALVSDRPLVGLEALPKGAALGAVRDPGIVALAQPPDVSIRQAAVQDWPKLTKKQSSWADYVYGKQPLFANRPVVFASACRPWPRSRARPSSQVNWRSSPRRCGPRKMKPAMGWKAERAA